MSIGRTLKKTKPAKFNFGLAANVETRQRSEKWKKESSKEKHIRCFSIDSSRTIRCSFVKKCPNHDPSCTTFRQIRSQTKSERVQENKIRKISVNQKALRSNKCADTKNPFCIHDIWVGGKRSYQPIPKNEENIMATLCDPEDELCLLAIKRATESPKASLENENDNVKTADPEVKRMMTDGRDLSPTGCDFIRNPNCEPEDFPVTPVSSDVLKRLQVVSMWRLLKYIVLVLRLF